MGISAGAETAVVALLLAGALGCTPARRGPEGGSDTWALHTARQPGYVYTVEYPASWGVEEDGTATHFGPAAPERGYVTVVVIDEEETPPPPVEVAYTTVRVIEAAGRSIPVQHRDPAAATERYVVRLPFDGHTAELRAVLRPNAEPDEAFEAAFDHMALSLSLTPEPNEARQ